MTYHSLSCGDLATDEPDTDYPNNGDEGLPVAGVTCNSGQPDGNC